MKSEPRGLPLLANWLRRIGTPAQPAPEYVPRAAGVMNLPRPAIRWVGPAGRIAIRAFDWNHDADSVCLWQRETYALNFPGFHFSESFGNAFRGDLRRANLDSEHGLFMLDDGAPCGFMWLVVCKNTWTSERYGYVNNIFIVHHRRGEGLGKELLSWSEEWFRKRRVSRVRLTVTASNSAACKLYESAGYDTTRWEMEKEL